MWDVGYTVVPTLRIQILAGYCPRICKPGRKNNYCPVKKPDVQRNKVVKRWDKELAS